jgi:hypothetical protein
MSDPFLPVIILTGWEEHLEQKKPIMALPDLFITVSFL